MLYAPQPMTQELITALRERNLTRVDELLQIPAVKSNADAHYNQALCWASYYGDLTVVNRLLEIPAVRDNAETLNNRALCWAVRNGHPAVACSLLATPAVRAPLENGSRKDFLTFFKRRLQNIKEHASLTFILDENSNTVSASCERGPLDAEINIVDILRDIGRRHGISPADFTEEELAILTFARRVDDSLYFKLSTNTTLMARLLAAPEPQPEPLPIFDPAAPASSSGMPKEAMEQPAKRQRVLGSLFDCFCRRRATASHDESGPGEPSSSSSRKRARQD